MLALQVASFSVVEHAPGLWHCWCSLTRHNLDNRWFGAIITIISQVYVVPALTSQNVCYEKRYSLKAFVISYTCAFFCHERAITEVTHPGNSSGSPEGKWIIQVQSSGFTSFSVEIPPHMKMTCIQNLTWINWQVFSAWTEKTPQHVGQKPLSQCVRALLSLHKHNNLVEVEITWSALYSFLNLLCNTPYLLCFLGKMLICKESTVKL